MNLTKENETLKKDIENSKKLISEITNNINNGELAKQFIMIKNENKKLINENKMFNINIQKSEIIELNKKLNNELEKEKIKISI